MKKLLLSVLAITGLVACTKSDVIEMPQSQAIKFGSAFVDNSTKAIDPTWDYEANNAMFRVWGKLHTSNAATNIFNAIDVVKGGTGIGDTWCYKSENVQYWIPSVNYSFAAIAGNTTKVEVDNNGMPSTIKYSAVTQSDLLYSTATATGAASNNDEVKFTFDHLLSRAQFKFVNAYPKVSNLYISVSDIKIVNPYKTGEYTITSKEWQAEDNSNYYLSFGNGVDINETNENANAIKVEPGFKAACYSNNIRLLIPATYSIADNAAKLQISFKVEVFLKQQNEGQDNFTKIEDLTQDYTTTYLVPEGVITFKKNCSYNFTITVGENDLEPIKFSCKEVNEWQSTNPYTSLGI